jgi:3-deoxy-D-arabino-heptulosonate 7-phosphate (DAHP) synthase
MSTNIVATRSALEVQEKIEKLNDTIKGIQSHVTFNGAYYPSTGQQSI